MQIRAKILHCFQNYNYKEQNMCKFAKTVLLCYASLDALTAKTQARLKNFAVKSHCLDGKCKEDTTLKLMLKAAELAEEKRLLAQLKSVTKQALFELEPKYRALLTLRYIKRDNLEVIMAKTRLCQTTLYRYYKAALLAFASKMTLLDCGKEWFEENYLRVKWINSLYKSVK